ncbi:RNA-guided endonuclease TnpB family protein [Salimicrobium flavidum]|uniref:Transposase, IS605 OrfB family, central region n=1 Tax=Salimicrobium flavidum TaxID=570947 RepID=A0A1N7IS97_9BACI|nr:RNA-guided endonuclease TnpB family protein [Salimicrobium flavidum]SIS39910.1 transposase, IS605 OrfB family, central region [Salimicrobium flavidum]
MATKTFLVRLKSLSKKKHKQFVCEQQTFASCVNHCVERLQSGEKLSSKNVPFDLKSAIKNEGIRKAKKAVSDVKKGLAKTVPTFRSSLGIKINNQNWNTVEKNGRWYIAFTTNEGKKTFPVVETEYVHTYFPFFTYQNREFRGTIEVLRKGRDWYVAVPVQVSSELDAEKTHKPYEAYTPVGVDLGLRHLAVLSEPVSGIRQFFSGKEVGFKRRHFRSLRRSLGKKKAQRALEHVGKKESRWMKDYNRKLAKAIVDFARQFDNPMIKMEQLDDIRKTCKSLKRADRTIHSWAFYQLKQFIREKAADYNIPVVDINPYQTSQECFLCGYAEKGNRHMDTFHCKKCGHSNHADLNASNNIATSTSLAV